jgi:thioesterase domain-containing protein
VGALTAELREELRERKQEILDFLRSAGSLSGRTTAIVPIQPRGRQPPVFGTAGHNGDVFCYRALAQHLGEDQPLYGLRPPGLDNDDRPLDRVEELAEYFASEIRAFHSQGSYVIAGFCAGGSMAFELARQLSQKGPAPSYLALFGAPYVTAYRRWARLCRRVSMQMNRVLRHLRALITLPAVERRAYVAERLRNRGSPPPRVEASRAMGETLRRRAAVERATFASLRRYEPGFFDGHMKLFLPCQEWIGSSDKPLLWGNLARRVEEYFGPDSCTTDTMLLEPYAAAFAEMFAPKPKVPA